MRWLLLLAILPGLAPAQTQSGSDWMQFGWDLAASSASTAPTGITSANAGKLQRRQVQLAGTVDASPIFLKGVQVKGSPHDVFFLTTIYGKTLAVDANSGSTLWDYTPPQYANWARTAQITNSTPVADPDRHHIYAASPDGNVQKLDISDGHALWRTAITLLPAREKIASPLREFRGNIVAVTGGYIGDRPPYQGHVAVLDAQTGKLLHVWNSLCSDRTGLIRPDSCSSTHSAIWGRAGPVIDAATGNIYVATGNGSYNGKTDWGDSIVELNSVAARMLGSYTPADHSRLRTHDLDLGSTSPVLLGGGMILQGGKDKLIRLVGAAQMAGAGANLDHELQIVSTPSKGMLYTAPAVWRHDGQTWIFVADYGATSAWAFKDGKLSQIWKNAAGGTSPVLAGGLLYVYDPQGGLRIYDPLKGSQLANLPTGKGHWNSPIAIDGKIALPEGNANLHQTTGVLDIWSLPPNQP